MATNNITFSYTIDNEDKIVRVCDNWVQFAQENEAAETLLPRVIENKPIWKFIEGDEAKMIYESIFKTIRTHNKSVALPFRCDSPDKRRYLKLVITPVQHDHIEFVSHLLREEDRDAVEILKADFSRSNEFVVMCCMCKKIKLPPDIWVEVEEAVEELKLFELIELPQINHSICPECTEIAMEEISRITEFETF